MTDRQPPDRKPARKKRSRRLEDKAEDAETIGEFILEEMPAVGTAARLYRTVKRRLSAEYRTRIDELESQQLDLIETINAQARALDALQALVLAKQAQISDLEAALKALRDKS